MTTGTDRWVGYLLAALASIAIAVQAQWNGEFGQLVDNPVEAAWLGFLLGLAALIVVNVARARQRDSLRRFSRALMNGFPPWQLVGGLAGATMIISQAAAVPTLGVALFSVLLVSGQTIMSLGVDRWGLAPGGHRPVTPARTLGAVLTVIGVALAVSGRISVGSVAIWWVLAIILVGSLLPFQQAFNAQIAGAAGSPLVAALVNFTVGAIALTLVMLSRWVFAGVEFSRPPSPLDHPTAWAAGLLGVFFVLVAAVVVPRVGVLVFGLITIAGQLIASLVIDALGGQIEVSTSLISGTVLCVVAVGIGSLRRTPRLAGG